MLTEQGSMNIQRSKAGRASNDDVFAVLIPLQNGPWTDAELSPDVRGNGNLTLCREPRLSQRHTSYYQGNENRAQQSRLRGVCRRFPLRVA